MKPFKSYEAKKAVSRQPIPAGGYVVKVLDAVEITYSWGNVLQISFDVIEGEHTGFFAADYKNNTNEDRKWRGVIRLTEPKEDGSEKDGWTIRSFNNAMFCFEDSNPGFHWDWDEKKLKGLIVGALFRKKEWEWEGKTGWTSECCALATAEDIRANKFTVPKDKPLAKKTTASQPGPSDFEEIVDDNDLPFPL